MFIIRHKKIFLSISIILVLASLASIFTYGLNLGMDFRGGTVAEVIYSQNLPTKDEIVNRVVGAGLDSPTVQTVGANGYLVKLKPLTETERQAVVSALSASTTADTFQIKRFSSIGPSVGAELANKGIMALIGVALLIILFIAFAFRHVSRPVRSWKYGLIAVLALSHDVTIPLGVFAYLGHFYGNEIDTLFLTAILTIMALSVSDTIVVFDRIRENLKNKLGHSFEETVGISIDETIVRSLITSLTIIFVLLVLFFFGSSSTRDFALVLTLGMFFGTYSSIFLASPMLVVAYNRQEAKKLKK
jgi:preprotein translocase subunit SecF